MTEAVVAVIFALVIVVGMTTGHVWSRLLSEGMPLVRDWARAKLENDSETSVLRRYGDDREALIRRVHHLEEHVEFLESMISEDAGSQRSLAEPDERHS